MKNQFDILLNDLNIVLSSKQKKQFEDYFSLLVEWNSKVNLTSITDKEDVYIKHFYDSLCLTKAVSLSKQTVLDVGSGAGFPSIPLKIVFPNLDITIVDSLNKRILFLTELSKVLGIDVKLQHERIEEHTNRSYYDIVTARAVAPFNILSELCIPFVKKEGLFLPMKSISVQGELQGSESYLKKLGASLMNIVEYDYLGYQRSIPIVLKNQETNPKYPRAFSKIKKSPL